MVAQTPNGETALVVMDPFIRWFLIVHFFSRLPGLIITDLLFFMLLTIRFVASVLLFLILF